MQTRSKSLQADIERTERTRTGKKQRASLQHLLHHVSPPDENKKRKLHHADEHENKIQRPLSPIPPPTMELSEDKKKELRMIFRLFDINKDGHVTLDELEGVLRSMGLRPTRAQVGAILRAGDRNGNGTIEFEELARLMAFAIDCDDEIETDKSNTRGRETERRRKRKGRKRSTSTSCPSINPSPTDNASSKSVSRRNGKEEDSEVDIQMDEDEESYKNRQDQLEFDLLSDQSSNLHSEDSLQGFSEKDEESSEKKEDNSQRKRDRIFKQNSGLFKKQTGVSIASFYTHFAGLHDEIESNVKDQFDNPEGREYDLGREGAFKNFNILVGLFCKHLTPGNFRHYAGNALEQKGFNVVSVTSESEFIEKLSASNSIYEKDEKILSPSTENSEKIPQRFDLVWLISGDRKPTDEQKFVNTLRKFHEIGGGLCFWADNVPWTATINSTLKNLFDFELVGSTPGGKVLKIGEPYYNGCFSRHLLTSGISNLFEGITISRPSFGSEPNKPLAVLATSTDKFPCILYADYSNGLEENRGRVVIDTGFTKLYNNWDTAGTARFVRNVSVWLLGLDHRMKIGAPLQGKLERESILL